MARRRALAARIDRAWREATGATGSRGAQKWIARLARLHPLTVSRILAGRQQADRIEAVLDAIEQGRSLGRAPEGDPGEAKVAKVVRRKTQNRKKGA